MTDRIEGPYADFEPVAERRPARKLPVRAALIGAALLALGVGGGATIAQMTGPSVEMAPVNPVAIRSLSDNGSVISVRGKVAEVYGPMFVLADGSGRALVDLGRQGDGTGLVSAGQAVTVQGRYGHGLIHASFLVAADGKVVALRPMGPPPHGPGGPGGQGGPGGPGDFRPGPHDRGPRGPGAPGAERGPDGGPDGADTPPPPPAAAPAPAAPAPAATAAAAHTK
ncbi:hypothetical protein [Sphingomonas sp. PAMC 26605]|uniref:hypothetical protein n=1 Tax=Sphingomonas sp. PAMC 26605 TaxID=1112214 RepID=UPI00026CDD1C|nr:hypothetical protein [Sphingomonas sp. PAMC 26605]